MKRNVITAEKTLLVGLGFILLFMIFHDWVPLGPLNDVSAVFAEQSLQEVITVALIGSVQILLLLGLVWWFRGRKYPLLAKLWLIIHQSSIFIGVLLAWWVPYFFNYGAEARAERYERLFGNTHSFLPEMNGITPNTLHFLFHLTLLGCILLSIYVTRRSRFQIDSLSIE